MSIVQAGEEVLRRWATDVRLDDVAGQEIADLIDALRGALVEAPGVGIAAPQIGVPLRVVLIQDPSAFHEAIPPARLVELERSPIESYVLINPELELVADETRTFFEGCLSFGEGGFRALVERSRSVRVLYLDEARNQHDELRTGWHARILQHEIDHLNGVLIVDRMLSHAHDKRALRALG